ncbi:MAG: hypothetical protein RL113_159, partial [Pseudomonadota bacterium]
MFNHRFYTSTKPFLMILCFILMATNGNAIEETDTEDSVIVLPIHADLTVLEKFLNDEVPNDLASLDERNKSCVDPQYIKRPAIPSCKLKGFSFSCRDWTEDMKVFPRIKCHVQGWIKRNGHITVNGNGQTLQFTFPIKAQASADGLLYGTAHAAAMLYINATPTINKDWTISIDLEHNFTWSNTPELKLFNLFNINIKSVLEPKLKKAMDKFAQKVPDLLDQLDIKGKMQEEWEDIQKPIKIDNQSETYLVFQPNMIACSQIDIKDHIMRSTVSIKGKANIILGTAPANYDTTKLSPLQPLCYTDKGFNLHLPIKVTYNELLERTKNEKSARDLYTIDFKDSVIPGVLNISNPKIIKNEQGTLSISAHVSYDSRDEWLKMLDKFHWFDIQGEVMFSGTPEIDKNERTIKFTKLTYQSNTNSKLFDMLIHIAGIGPIQSYLQEIVHFDYGDKIDEWMNKINDALRNVAQGDLILSGH